MGGNRTLGIVEVLAANAGLAIAPDGTVMVGHVTAGVDHQLVGPGMLYFPLVICHGIGFKAKGGTVGGDGAFGIVDRIGGNKVGGTGTGLGNTPALIANASGRYGDVAGRNLTGGAVHAFIVGDRTGSAHG
nr:hypothetical protein SPACI_40980 [Sporomusa acidovorans DSM 3132]